MDDLDRLTNSLLAEVATADSAAAVEDLRVAALGKKGSITGLMKTLGTMDAEERKAKGQAFNAAKDRISAALDARKTQLGQREMDARLAFERIDVTLPVRAESQGRIHPVSQVTDEITAIFADMGFKVAEGPDIEDDWHNFTALNIPPNHPARQMHDTFYLPPKDTGETILLRTHTSPVQIRHMMSGPPPHRIIAPGRTYRCDSDMTHTPMFHQVEGLVIDRNIHMGHLKGCLEEFTRAIFGIPDLRYRLRPSHFPFTEPSAEMDIGCSRKGGVLKIGEGDDWLEILGCGMVHPKVLEAAGIDPNEWQGFAFGMGIDRIAMLKYGIPDLRAFFEADVRWLRHYGFSALDVPTLSGGLVR
ncbi:MAG: phenylalanine--tRNA ligase subunit alpha [Alphaproteobacteria bacterium]|nr:phenylalanine--tRNA ligase subunit alpha [Alphaproteobacteria bacterium]